MEIRIAEDQDFEGWFGLRKKLWPQCPESSHQDEMLVLSNDDSKVCLIACNKKGIFGFMELSLRSIVDGCDSSPVAYVEGWYVDPDFRSKGVGKALLVVAEKWARDVGCTEMGSDTEIENKDSIQIHQKLGFEVVDRIVQFKKRVSR